MKNITFILILAFFSSYLFFSCNNIWRTNNLNLPTNSQAIKSNSKFHSAYVYLARKNLNTTEFEQFNMVDDILVYECGKLEKGKHNINSQETRKITKTEIEEAKISALKVAQISKKTKIGYEKPGDLSTMFDTGKLSIELKIDEDVTKIHTSLDSIVNGKTNREKSILNFIKNIRANLNDTCGNKKFYKIG